MPVIDIAVWISVFVLFSVILLAYFPRERTVIEDDFHSA